MKRSVWAGIAVLAVALGGAMALAGCGGKREEPKVSVKEAVKNLDVAVLGKGPSAKICPVSGDEIGADMGKPYEYTMADGKKIMLCCPSCRKVIDQDPAKYSALFY